MSDPAGKFFPLPTPVTRPWWEACRKQQLLIQHCPSCNNYQFYPRSLCTQCMHRELEWVRASGRGKVETWTVIRRPVSQAYAAEIPYVVALIRLDEGPVMMSQLTECDPEQVNSGMQVEVVFEAWSDEITVPKFTPNKTQA